MADGITYELKRHVATLSTSTSGWTKELNFISWNGRDPKFDVRDWSPDHEKMSKGLTFTVDEMTELCKALMDELGPA